MKIFNFNLKIIVQTLFVIIFFTSTAKSLDKFNKAERFSDYFSGILLLNENQYEGSLKYFEKLNGLETKHINYSVKYLYSLINSGKFKEAFNYSRRLEKKNLDIFESDLISGIFYIKNSNTDLAKKYFDAKKAGTLVSAGSKNITKQKQLADKLNKQTGYARFAVGAVGGAAGEAFVADVEEIGSFGDMFDRGPTQLDSYALDGGREDATRKLMNRLKFGSESLLITPFAAGIGKGAKALATRGKDLAYSNYKLERFLGKFAQAFTPEGPLTKEVFGSQKVMEGFRSADVNRATELVRQLDANISKSFPQMQAVLDRSLTKKEKDQFLKEINDLMLDGDLTKLVDGKKSDAFVKTLKDKGVDQKVIDSIVGTVDEARSTIGNLIKTTNNYNSKELKDIYKID